MMQRYDLSKKFVLSQVPENEIFSYYLGHDVNLKDLFCNPLRVDATPGCSYFIRNTDGRLIFNDFAWRQFDCIDIVKILFRVSFPKALEIIYNDLIEKKPRNQPIIDAALIQIRSEKRLLKMRIRRRKFRPAELAFWTMNGKLSRLGVSEEHLVTNKIYCLDCYEENHVQISNCKFTFAYHWFDYNYQLYFPMHGLHERKFINPSGIKYGDAEFVNFDSDYLVITKSKKCAYYLRLFGVNVMFVINERILLTKEFMDSISHMTVFTLFDNDWTGMRLTIEYRQAFGTIGLQIPKPQKDFTEFVDAKDIDEVYCQIEQIKQFYNVT